MLARGEMPPSEFTRHEVAEILMETAGDGSEPSR
jgi:ATP sulfurylase